MDRNRLHKLEVWKTRFDPLRSVHRGHRLWRGCGLEDGILVASKERELWPRERFLRPKRGAFAPFMFISLRRLLGYDLLCEWHILPYAGLEIEARKAELRPRTN